jgi:hypothetical protein
MGRFPSDTHPDVERMLIERLRQLPASRKWELVGELNHRLRVLALSDLKHQYPAASPSELRLRLAHRMFGSHAATKVYGPLPE